MGTKLVGEVMSRQVHAVPPEMRVSEVVADMHRMNIGAVIVMREGEPAGIFTERDLLNRVVAAGTDPKEIPVSAVMTAKVMGVSPDAAVEVAALLMHKRGFRHLPVLENGAVAGILSVRDVLGALLPDGGRRPGDSRIGLAPPGL